MTTTETKEDFRFAVDDDAAAEVVDEGVGGFVADDVVVEVVGNGGEGFVDDGGIFAGTFGGALVVDGSGLVDEEVGGVFDVELLMVLMFIKEAMFLLGSAIGEGVKFLFGSM